MRLFGLEISRAVRKDTPIAQVVDDRRGGWWPIIREPFAGAFQRDVAWTTETVLAHHAVYACITLISSDIGKLRPKLMTRTAAGIWEETESAAFSKVLRQPNHFQNYKQFDEWWTTSKLTYGNTYVLLERDERNVVRAMYVLDPSRVTVLVAPDGAVFYDLRNDNLSGIEEASIRVPASEIAHDRMNCLFHPLVGVSPIFACGLAANLSLKIQNNSARFFGKGSNPSGILTAPVPIDQTTADRIAEKWAIEFSGDNAGKVAVLPNGMQFTPMRMTAVDSQVIQQLKWTAETVCSTFHVPPFKAGVGAMPAYNNPEILNQVYYSDCLQSLIESFELVMDAALGLTTTKEGGRQLGIELDLDALLRMDQPTQIKSLGEGVAGAIMTPNEARMKLDLPPLTGGNTVYMQQQNFSLEALSKRDAREDPFASATPPAPKPEPESDEDEADEEEDRPDAEEEERSGVAYWKAAIQQKKAA